MNQTFMGCHVANLIRTFLAISLMALLSACGGGGGSAGTTSGSTGKSPYPNGKISVSLFDAGGNSSNSVTAGNLLTARATVYDTTGTAPAKNVIVTFTLSNPWASLVPSSGTALTDANGVAQISLLAAVPGAIRVTATATVTGTTAISADVPFQVSAGPNVTNPDGKIQLGLIDLSGGAGNLLTSAGVLTAKAIVTNNLGAAAAGVVVTFTVDSPIASLLPASGTALTDSSGVAQISLKAGVGTGAGTLTAKAIVVGSTAIFGTANFAVGTSNSAVPTAVNFVSAAPSNKSIVIKGSGGNGRTEVALLTFSVVDSANVGIANRKVNFTTQSTETVSLVASSGITDASGNVTAAVNSGDKPTTVRVVATVDGTSPAISTISDTVAVTTGLPTQLSFTIMREKNNVEGFDFGNIQNKITVLMADANGGVVANGTPVVFTTDSGAIIGDEGGNDTARCLTVNGTCFVTWRSQSPNKSVVTVTATATNGNTTLTGTTQFTNSASSGSVTNLPGTVTFTAATCFAQSIFVTVVDRNGYTMPGGTTLAFADVTNVAAKVYPDKVTAPTSVSAGGTTHEVTFTPTALCPVGIGHAYFEVKSPFGISQSYRISVIYN